MSNKDVKAEARRKVALNMHQAIVAYTIIYVLLITLIALIVMGCLLLQTINPIGAIVMICYGGVLLFMTLVCCGLISYGMVDFYLASYKCKPYNVRRIGDTLARNGVTKIFALNLKRGVLGFLLLLCFIVPGVVYLVRTSMAAHLLIANPKMKSSMALSASGKVMSGKSGSYFGLMMSLFGWWLLGVFTLGLGFIFILPYTNLCKTVYYKRNLQGDKTVYQPVIQPVSPAMSVPQPTMVYAAPEAHVIQPAAAQKAAAPQEQPVPPIDTLAADDVAEMNATMRDVNAEEAVVDVPEVAIPPVSGGKKGSGKTFAAKNAEQKPEPAAADKIEHAIDDSDLVEIVKPLTTQEISDADVMSKKINDMFFNAAPKDISAQHDYFANAESNQSPDDFITTELPSEGGDDGDEFALSDADVNEFLKDFDAQTQAEAAANEPVEIVIEPVDTAEPPAEEKKPDPQSASARIARPSSAFGSRASTADRLEKLRREREERLKNQSNKK